MSKGEPMSYDDANKIAKGLLVKIGLLKYTEKIAIVGSLRRKEEIVNDIDFQICGDSYYVKRCLGQNGFYTESDGTKRQIYTNALGVYINCFYTFPDHWGSALMHNTGPKKYNVRKRYLIKKKGWILNQYGLYRPRHDEDSDESDDFIEVASKTEQDIYDALDWTYCKPEDRK